MKELKPKDDKKDWTFRRWKTATKRTITERGLVYANELLDYLQNAKNVSLPNEVTREDAIAAVKALIEDYKLRLTMKS